MITNLCILAQAGGQRPAAGGGMGMLLTFFPFIVLMFGWLWLQGRSQKKKDAQRDEMLSKIRPGDRIVTIGGIHLKVVAADKDDYLIGQVDENRDVRMKVNRSAISKVLNPKDEKKEKQRN